MFLNSKTSSILVFFLCTALWQCAGKVRYYILTERPALTYFNKSYVSYVNVTSRRFGRGSPMYYVDIHFNLLVYVDNTYKLSFYFYEFLSNEYRRGFVEMHFEACDLQNPFFGVAMKQACHGCWQTCPYPPGEYHLCNMTIPSVAIPPGFPFTKGRIYLNVTHNGVVTGSGHIDMELKEKLIRPDRA